MTPAQREASAHNHLRFLLAGVQGHIGHIRRSPLITANQERICIGILSDLDFLYQNMAEERRDPATGLTRKTVLSK